MMKSGIAFRTLAAALACSSASLVFAAGTALTAGTSTTISTKGGAGSTCDVLQSTVTVGLSNNVQGAYDCREPGVSGGLSTPAAIGVATCHLTGLVKARSFTCDPVNGASATATVNNCVQAADGSYSGSYTAAGAGMFNAVSTGGAVIAAPIPVCDSSDTVAAALTPIVDAALADLAQ